MATCGYLCPVCEGKGFEDDGTNCHWCSPVKTSDPSPSLSSDLEEWIEKVHQGPCCSDRPEDE